MVQNRSTEARVDAVHDRSAKARASCAAIERQRTLRSVSMYSDVLKYQAAVNHRAASSIPEVAEL